MIEMEESKNDPMEGVEPVAAAPAPTVSAEDAFKEFKDNHYVNGFKNRNLIRFLAIADTIHDFRHGYRAKSLPADGASEANRFLRSDKGLIDKTITGLSLDINQQNVFNVSANYHDIETAIREYFEEEANVGWIKPLGNVLTSAYIIGSEKEAQQLANEIRQKAIAVEIQIDRSHMENDTQRHKIRDFMIAFLFQDPGANCHLTCDAGPNIIKKLVHDSPNVQGLIMPQNMMDSATAGGQELTGRPDKYFFPYGSDPLLGVRADGSNSPIAGGSLGTTPLPDFDKNTGNFGPASGGAGGGEAPEKIFQSVANSMTFNNINFYYTGYKTFKDKDNQYGFEQVIRHMPDTASPLELKLSLGSDYSSGPSLDMLLGVHIKTKNYRENGPIDNVRPNGKVLHLTEFINSLPEENRKQLLNYAKKGINEKTHSLFMDIKRAGDWDQCLATFLARDIVENVALVTGDSTCAIRSQTYDNPTIFQFGKIVRLYRSSISSKPLSDDEKRKIEYYGYYNEIKNKYEKIVKFFCIEENARNSQIDKLIGLFDPAEFDNFFIKTKKADIQSYLNILKLPGNAECPSDLNESPNPTDDDIKAIVSLKDKYKAYWENVIKALNLAIEQTFLVEIDPDFLNEIVKNIDEGNIAAVSSLFNFDERAISAIEVELNSAIYANTYIQLKGSANIIGIIENYNEMLAYFCNNLMDKKVAFEIYNTYQIIFKKQESILEENAIKTKENAEKLKIEVVTKGEEKIVSKTGRQVRVVKGAVKKPTTTVKPPPPRPSTRSSARLKGANTATKAAAAAVAAAVAAAEAAAEAAIAETAAKISAEKAAKEASEATAALIAASGAYPNNIFKAVYDADDAAEKYQTIYNTGRPEEKRKALATVEESENQLIKIIFENYDLLNIWKKEDRSKLFVVEGAAGAGAAGAGALTAPDIRDFYINKIYQTKGEVEYDYVTEKLKEKLGKSISSLIQKNDPVLKHKFRIARLAVRPWVNFPASVHTEVIISEIKAAIIAADGKREGELAEIRNYWATKYKEEAKAAEIRLNEEAVNAARKAAEKEAGNAAAAASNNTGNNNEESSNNNENDNFAFRRILPTAGISRAAAGAGASTLVEMDGGKRQTYYQYGGGPLPQLFIDELTNFFRAVSQNVNHIISEVLPEVSNYERYLYIKSLIDNGDTEKFIRYEMDRFGILENPIIPGTPQPIAKPTINSETINDLTTNMVIGRLERFLNYIEILDEILLSDTMTEYLKEFLSVDEDIQVGEKRMRTRSANTTYAKRMRVNNGITNRYTRSKRKHNESVAYRNTRSTTNYNKPATYFNYLNRLINECIDKMNNGENTINETISFRGEELTFFGVEMALAYFFDFISNTSTSYFTIILEKPKVPKIEFEKTPEKMFTVVRNLMILFSRGRYDPSVVTSLAGGGRYQKTYKNRKDRKKTTRRHK